MIAAALPLLWLPPLPPKVPQEFQGSYAINLEGCTDENRGLHVTVSEKEIEFREVRPVEDMVLIDPDTLVLRTAQVFQKQTARASPDGRSLKGIVVDSGPPEIPPQLFVLSKIDADHLKLRLGAGSPQSYQPDFTLFRCKAVLDNAPNQ